MRGWLVSILVIACTVLFAQNYAITGVVYDTTNTPIPNVEITVKGTLILQNTDQSGSFSIPNLVPGTYTVEFYHKEYSDIYRGVTILNEDVNLEISLKSEVVTREEVYVNVDNQSRNLYSQLGHDKLKDLDGTHINAAHKTEVTNIEDQNSNKSAPPARQTYAKNPGITVLQSDAAGIQLDIGARGMNPKRTANFNTRQNGYDISADALGYPESYYTPVLEGVKEIQIVRGAASLEYGPQFGGLLNFVMKEGPTNDRFELTSRSSVGAYGFYSFFNSVGGQLKKTNYYAFHQYKGGNDWRPNSDFKVNNLYGAVRHSFSDKLELKVEYTHMNYLAQQAGGLTDSQFYTDPKQSTRDRNFFKINWNLANACIKWQPSSTFKFENQTFVLNAQRASLGNLDIGGDVGLSRDLIDGRFNNIGNETRILKKYLLGKRESAFTSGIRLYQGNTNNRQGVADNGDYATFKYLADSLETSNYRNPSFNFSYYIENLIRFDSLFNMRDQLTIVPGYRLEYINTESKGIYRQLVRDKAQNIIAINEFDDSKEKDRLIHLFGVGMSYRLNPDNPIKKKEYYINFTKNYKSVTFSDLSIVNPNFLVDPNIKDETGFNFDIGARGRIFKYVVYDLSAFYLYYNDRIGTWQKDHRQERTNIGNSRNIGVEALVQTELFQLLGRDSSKYLIIPFINFSTTDAQYISTRVSGVLEGNRVEMVPTHSITAGIEVKNDKFGISYQYNYVGEYFSDAGNTYYGDQFYGIQGLIPSYSVMDLSLFYNINKTFRIEGSINNLANNEYFTRRATSYPGPGIIPAALRSYFVTLQIKL